MRLHITLDDELVQELDRRVGPRRRSGFIKAAIASALENERRWDLVRSAFGRVSDEGHPWDTDPAAWVSAERRSDTGRLG